LGLKKGLGERLSVVLVHFEQRKDVLRIIEFALKVHFRFGEVAFIKGHSVWAVIRKEDGNLGFKLRVLD